MITAPKRKDRSLNHSHYHRHGRKRETGVRQLPLIRMTDPITSATRTVAGEYGGR